MLYDGTNLSDHNPVTMQTSHNVLYTNPDIYQYKVIDWAKAKDIDISNYKSLFDFYLGQYALPLFVTNW